MMLKKYPVPKASRAEVIGLREDVQSYERLKREWIDKHPEASPREYEQAMRRIARECGV